MKRFLGFVSVALVGLGTLPLAANPALKTVTTDVVLQTQSARAVHAAEVIFNGKIGSSADLVGRQVMGVAVTAAEAEALYTLASPLAQVLASTSNIVVMAKDFDRMAELVSAEEAGVRPGAGITALTRAVEKGKIDNATIQSEIAQVRGENVANRLPSAIAQLKQGEFLIGYTHATKAGEDFNSMRFEDESVLTQYEGLLKKAATEANCVTIDANTCIANRLQAVEIASAQFLGVTPVANAADAGKRLGFVEDILDGFVGTEPAAELAYPEHYVMGDLNAVTSIAAHEAQGKKLPENLEKVKQCHLTGGVL